MRNEELSVQYLKRDHLLALVWFEALVSKQSANPVIKLYFVDEENRLFVHYQICESEKHLPEINRYFTNLGFNMTNKTPLDLYNDLLITQTCSKDIRESILGKVFGRIYYGTIVKRKMKSTGKIHFDVDNVCWTFGFDQDKMVQVFKSHNDQYERYLSDSKLDNFLTRDSC